MTAVDPTLALAWENQKRGEAMANHLQVILEVPEWERRLDPRRFDLEFYRTEAREAFATAAAHTEQPLDAPRP